MSLDTPAPSVDPTATDTTATDTTSTDANTGFVVTSDQTIPESEQFTVTPNDATPEPNDYVLTEAAPAAPAADTTSTAAPDAPAADTTSTDAPAAVDTSAFDAPSTTTDAAPTVDTSAFDAPAPDYSSPADPTATVNTTSTDAPAADTTSTDAPAADTTSTDAPAAPDAPAADTTSTDAPAADTTSTDAPAADTTSTDAPAADTTSTDTTSTDAYVKGADPAVASTDASSGASYSGGNINDSSAPSAVESAPAVEASASTPMGQPDVFTTIVTFTQQVENTFQVAQIIDESNNVVGYNVIGADHISVEQARAAANFILTGEGATGKIDNY